MRSPCQSRSTRLFGQGLARWQLLPRPGVLNHRLGLVTAAHFDWPPDQHVWPPRAGSLQAPRRPHRRPRRNTLIVDEADIMDLTTLVAACALAVDPKVMHALIWHQSGGEPWSFTVAGGHHPQGFRDVSDAVDAAHD